MSSFYKKSLIFIFLVIFIYPSIIYIKTSKNNGINQEQVIVLDTLQIKLDTLSRDFYQLIGQIRDTLISKENAIVKFKNIISEIKKNYLQKISIKSVDTLWTFPLQGYTAKEIGGVSGEGYIKNKGDIFDGYKHTGHPAQDIFIDDGDQDSKDDISKKSVNILSVTGGIVISCDSIWEDGSLLRGGKNIWVYEPLANYIFYYAHCNTIYKKMGDIIKKGDTLATVGRTGLNANKGRSPTHLHFMVLKLNKEFYPKHFNSYAKLKKAKVIK
jgi:hypothetical protein